MEAMRHKAEDDSLYADCEGGFTLVEMLVALAVLAVMGGMMSSFLTQFRAINRVELEISKQTELDAAAAYMQRLLSSIRPIKLLDAKPDKNPFIDGRNSSLRAALVTRQGIYSLGLKDISIYLEQVGDQKNLVHTLVPRRVENGKPVIPDTDPIPIVNDIDSIKFEYLTGESWSGSFSKDGEVPKAIRISLTAKIDKRALSAYAVSLTN